MSTVRITMQQLQHTPRSLCRTLLDKELLEGSSKRAHLILWYLALAPFYWSVRQSLIQMRVISIDLTDWVAYASLHASRTGPTSNTCFTSTN